MVSVHALLATGVNADGHREILGCRSAPRRDGSGWVAFSHDLVARGLSGVILVTSDAHPGLVATLPRRPLAALPQPDTNGSCGDDFTPRP